MAADENDFWGKGGSPGKQPEPDRPTPSNPPRKVNPHDSGLRDAAPASTPNFWGKETAGDAPAPTDQSEGSEFWTKAETGRKRDQAEREALLRDPDLKKRARRRTIKRVLLGVGGALVLALVLGVVFAPQIGSALAPGIIRDQAAEQIAGTATVENVALSWGGPQQVTGLRLADPAGKEVLRANLSSTAGLLGLIRGNLDLGEVTVTGGQAEIIRERDGSTNLQAALAPRTTAKPVKSKPASPPPESEARIPANLRVKAVVTSFDATLLDRSVPGEPVTITLRDLDAKVSLAAGEPLNAEATLGAFHGQASRGAKGGSLALKAKVDKWSRSDGLLTLSKSTGTATVQAADLPTSLVDVLAPGLALNPDGTPVSLATALGPAINMNVDADGDGSNVTANFTVAMAELSLGGSAAYSGNDVRTLTPVKATISGNALQAVAPQIAQSLAASGMTLDTMPSADLTIAQGTFPMPLAGKIDLRGVGIDATLALSETAGTTLIERGSAPNPPKPFRLTPMSVQVTSADLAKDIRLTGATSATLDGSPAGNLAFDISAGGLLDAAGSPKPGPPGTLSGTVSVKGIASAIAQPFVASTGIDLAQDFGPSVDLDLTASSDASKSASGELPPTSVRISMTAQHATLAAQGELTPTRVRTSGDGLTLTLARGGVIASRFVKPETGWTLAASESAPATLRVQTFAVPRDPATGAFKLDQANGGFSLEAGGLRLRQTGESTNASDIRVQRVNATVALKPGGAARVELTSAADHAGQPFEVRSVVDADNIYSADATGTLVVTPPLQLRPTGSIDINGLPPALARLFLKPPTQSPANGLNTAELLESALAGPTDIRVAFKGVPADAKAVDATIEVRSPRVTLDVGAAVNAERVAMRGLTATTTLTPELLATLLNAYAPTLRESMGQVSLAGPARIRLAAEPMNLPLNPDGSPALDRFPMARAQVTLAGQTYIDGLVAKEADGSSRALGRIGVEDFTVSANIPVAALIAPPLENQRRLEITAVGNILGASGPAILTLEGSAEGDISNGKPMGPLVAQARITRMNSRAVEDLAGQQGLLTGLLGPTADIDATFSITPPPEGFSEAMPISKGVMEAGVAVTSQRLKADKPVRVRLGADRIDLAEPAVLTLTPDPDAITRMLATSSNARQTGSAGTLELLDAQPITLRLTKFSIPREIRSGNGSSGPAQNAGAMAAAADVNLTLEAPGVTLRADGRDRITLNGTRCTIASERIAPDKNGKLPPGGPPLTFNLAVDTAQVGDTPPAKGLSLTGRLTSLFATDGAIDLSKGRVSMTGNVPAAPTALVDAMMKQDGAMTEALGPVIALRVNLDRVSILPPKPGPDGKYPVFDPAPVIDVEARSSRATATMKGTVNNGLYVSQQPLEVNITEMTADLVKRYVGIMPLIGVAEKTAQDAPAQITATDMAVPLDNNLSRLNAVINIDPGQVRFQTSGAFTDILNTLNQRSEGTLGRRLEPLRVDIKQGVASYARWRLPLGEFMLETVGVANLTDAAVRVTRPDGKEVELAPRSLDVVTWIPAGAVTEKAMSLFNVAAGSGLGRILPGVLEPVTLLPFRTTGPMDAPRTRPDSDLVGDALKDQLKENFDPRKLLEQLKPKTPTPSAPGTPAGPLSPPR